MPANFVRPNDSRQLSHSQSVKYFFLGKRLYGVTASDFGYGQEKTLGFGNDPEHVGTIKSQLTYRGSMTLIEEDADAILQAAQQQYAAALNKLPQDVKLTDIPPSPFTRIKENPARNMRTKEVFVIEITDVGKATTHDQNPSMLVVPLSLVVSDWKTFIL